MKKIFIKIAVLSVCYLPLSVKCNWKDLSLQSLPFPLTVGLIYQIGKSYSKSPIYSYLNKMPGDFIGNRGGITIGYNNVGQSWQYYCGFPLLIFFIGLCSNKLISNYYSKTKSNTIKNDAHHLLMGATLTIACSLIIPIQYNAFLWKQSDNTYINKIINFS